MTETPYLPQSSYPFNTPLESGLRTLVLLAAMSPMGCDLQRLVYYDYLLVHSGDVTETSDAPASVHPATPYRSGEVLVRRKLIDQGCRLMLSRELLTVEYTDGGIQYKTSALTDAFLSYLETPYLHRLRDCARFVASHFANFDDMRLAEFMTANLGRWGAEFVREAVVQRAADA